MQNNSPDILTCADGATIAYRRRAGKSPGVVFLGGFMSNMEGTKAATLDRFCAARGQAYLRFDFFGQGASSGDFAEATVGRWRADTLLALERLTDGPQILVGSSMGGWVMLLAALAAPGRVAALVGIAAAPDATEALMWARFPKPVRALITARGQVRIPSEYSPEGYLITRKLIEDGRAHLVMADKIPLACPARLIHGMQDKHVPWQTSQALAAALASEDVQLILVKDGDHRLSREQDLALLCGAIEPLLGR